MISLSTADLTDLIDARDLPDPVEELLLRRIVQVEQCIFHFTLGLTGHAGDIDFRAADDAGELGDHIRAVLMENTDPVSGLAFSQSFSTVF